MANRWERLVRKMNRILWEQEVAALPWHRRVLVRTAQILRALAIDLYDGRMTQLTTSLVYTTLLSLVPLLAFGFSVLTGLGMQNRLEPLLLGFLAPLGSESQDFANRILGFVGQIEVGVLGTVGLGFLLFTVGSLIYKIETGFNFIWDIREARSWPQSVSGYLSVIFGGPVLLFTATGMTAAVLDSPLFRVVSGLEPLGTLVTLVSQLIPYLLVIGAFTLFYLLVPNTPVPLVNAFTGGVVAGLLWQLSGWAFGTFVATSTNYTFIYSGFAIGLLFMIWLYLSWLILLVGARITFYFQHPEYLGQPDPGTPLRGRPRQRAALTAMFLLCRSFQRREPAWTLERLEARLGIPRNPLKGVLEDLHQAGLIAPTRDEPPAFLPAMDPYGITVKAVMDAVSLSPGKREPPRYRLRPHPVVNHVLERADRALEREFVDTSLGALVETGAEDGDQPRELGAG
ncbi:YhjD/YihY/BrkB family envelope integrity protein [Thiohalorhabdus methylotrophus]|uniref:YhjD/YihY/BrkB family envelope integrity protein n=1 Tax=Thiohalorhabdus methylotrophus TaxID=3242694 RepID=A0ABV4TZA9_9GAMM